MAWKSLRSAGTLSPIESWTMSPGTRYLANTSLGTPSRSTVHIGGSRDSIFSRVFSDLFRVTQQNVTIIII